MKKQSGNPRRRTIVKCATMTAVGILICATARMTTDAKSGRYNTIEQTESAEVIALTEEVAEIYSICPELLQAMAFFESNNQPRVVSAGGDIGLMQVNPRWHQERMDRLGVTDLTDGRGCIMVGADYLHELFQEYEDPALVLMCYNMGTSNAIKEFERGAISNYAKEILQLSQQLERLHEDRERQSEKIAERR